MRFKSAAIAVIDVLFGGHFGKSSLKDWEAKSDSSNDEVRYTG
jgi:hypothetical protein